VRLSRLCLPALAALAFAGHAAAASDVQIVKMRALAPAHGPAAGRVVVTTTVRYRPTRGLLIAAPNPSRTVDIARLVLTIDGAQIRDADHLVRWSGRPLFYTHRIVLGALMSNGALDRGRLRIAAHAEQVIRSDGTEPAGTPGERRVFDLPVLKIPELPAPAPAVCEQSPQSAPFSRETLLTVVCMGEGVRIRLAGRPEHGSVRMLRSEPQRAVLSYTPKRGFVGRDRIPLRAGSITTSLPVDVQPFKLRAIGDSVTAGFGFFQDGTAWGAGSLPFCIPPTPPNNRCSSNSPNGSGSTNPVGWSPDFGLGNNISWAAQFANSHGITGPGQYQNWAVSGSTPTDWASGYLSTTLQQIAAGRPDLVVMTLGANPLLDTFLFGNGLECAFARNDPELIACVQRYIDAVALIPNLKSVFQQLLGAQDARVVVSQYHLAIPAAALYSVHQLEVMFGVVNGDIASAVQTTTGYGTRLFLMTPPRFDVGLPTGPYKCEGRFFTSYVDGPSHQATVSQVFLTGLNPTTFCGGDPWIISADSGIHPNAAGYTQYAQALGQVVSQNNLLPTVLENR
jgi:lysophospholipase L1-like esterase